MPPFGSLYERCHGGGHQPEEEWVDLRLGCDTHLISSHYFHLIFAYAAGR